MDNNSDPNMDTTTETTTTVSNIPVHPPRSVLTPPPSTIAPITTSIGVAGSAPVATPIPVPPPVALTPMGAPIMPATPVLVSPVQMTPVVALPTPTPATEPAGTTTTTVSTSIPEKKKMSPVVLALTMFFILALVGGAVFAISRAVNTQEAVAPTAPTSEPAAQEPISIDPTTEDAFNPLVDTDCSGIPNTAPFGSKCLPTFTGDDGTVYWAPGTNLE